MKKIFAILSAALTLAACTKEMDVPVLVPEDDQPISVDITIDRIDAFEGSDTRATIKTNWYEGDVVFVFFKGIDPPKYLELKYKSGKWVATGKNGLTASDLSGATEKRMSANYLPYGSSTVLQADGYGGYSLDRPYNGVYYYAKPTDYTYDSQLHGSLNLKVFYNSDGYKYVHFDVTGYNDRHAYAMYLENVKSINVSQLQYGGISVAASLNKPITGHIDKERGVLTFSALLATNAVGSNLDYQFSISDETDRILYTRDAGNHTLSKSTVIGLGNLTGSKWKATEYVYMGIDLNGMKLCWAKKNLGATVEKGEGSYGKYYAFMKTTGYANSGTFGNYTMNHSFNSGNYPADPDGDPATYEMKGLWHVPTKAEYEALMNNTDQIFSDANTVNAGVTFKSKIAGYTDKTLFLPAAGYNGTTEVGRQGWYWTSNKEGQDGYYDLSFNVPNSSLGTQYTSRCYFGMNVRPVFGVPSLEAGVIDP